MNLSTLQITVLCVCLVAVRAAATTYYVDINSTNPTPPFTNWSTASTSIQKAINEATNGDLVLVNPGIYRNSSFSFRDPSNDNAQVESQIGIPSGVTVASVSGPAVTVIQGFPLTCATLIGKAMLSGFTLTNGSAVQGSGIGGGAYCQSTNAFICNCIICSNSAGSGGGVFLGTISNCVISNNFASFFGGGVYGSVLKHSVLAGNVAANRGAAAYLGALDNCIVIRNQFSLSSAATLYSNSLNNCLVLDNAQGGTDPVVWNCWLTNCTISGNYNVNSDANNILESSTLRNCIFYGNSNQASFLSVSFKNCCVQQPYPYLPAYGITNDPEFVNPSAGDFHLQSSSPCINSGNNAYISSGTDLDGNPRIAGGTVDIGAYEYQTPTSVISYDYLQQYGLPTDGSVDFADLDGTTFNVYQDWIAGLNPTNAASVLAMLTPVATNTATGVTVTWESVSGIPYFLQSSTNLAAQSAFTTIQTNITGQTGTTTYTDTSATNNVPYFYRVGVVAP